MSRLAKALLKKMGEEKVVESWLHLTEFRRSGVCKNGQGQAGGLGLGGSLGLDELVVYGIRFGV